MRALGEPGGGKVAVVRLFIRPSLRRGKIQDMPPSVAGLVARPAPLLVLLLALNLNLPTAEARVRLGDSLPPHPWAVSTGDEREIVVLYSHDCGDLGELWSAVLGAGLPVRVINAEEVAAPAPIGLSVWHGPEATAFARALKVSAYPTVLLVRGERVLNAWEGDFTAQTKL